jgi:hypothetical protein
VAELVTQEVIGIPGATLQTGEIKIPMLIGRITRIMKIEQMNVLHQMTGHPRETTQASKTHKT